MKNLMVLALVLGSLVGLGMATHLHRIYYREGRQGQQDLCATVRCGYSSKCQVVNGRATCVCDEQSCTANYQPVCGTDGKTYSNDCKLRAEACKRQRDIQVASQGECACHSKGHKSREHGHHQHRD